MNLRPSSPGLWPALALLFSLALGPAEAHAERFAHDPATVEGGEIFVTLSHGVILRFDGSTRLHLEAPDRTLAQVELRVLAKDPTDPPPTLPGPLRSVVHHWRYYHVDGVAFWHARTDASGRPALVTTDGLPWRHQRRTVRPHVSVGRAKARTLQIHTRRFESEKGPIYVGWLRLDGREGQVMPGPRSEIRWDGDCEWPLAFLVARTEEELLFQAGQAEWTYEEVEADDEHRWAAPPLCARCRNPEIARLRLQLEAGDDAALLHAVFEGTAEPRLVSAEGLTLLGHRLGDRMVAEGESGATYEIDRDEPWLADLLDAARLDQVKARVPMATGLWVEPRTVDLEVDPELRDPDALADDSPQIPAETELPDHLSPRLVQSWPNPFREQTTIEVTIPRTLGEAFDLDEELRAKVDPQAPPPFGPDPMVLVRVYNVGGQLIQLLGQDVRQTSRFSIRWDGRDLQGRSVAAGAYYVNVEMGDWNVTKRVLRLKP